MKLPKIVYDPGTGAVTLNFTYPPVQKLGSDSLAAIRTDTESTAGALQSVCERVIQYKTLQLDFVPAADLPAWDTFMRYALTGGVFTYYPDATVSGDHDDWTLADTDWSPSQAMKVMAKFKVKMRKQVAL